MDNNFWQKLKNTGRPILALAPMAGVTDIAFRQVCKEQGANVLYSEMASAAALKYKPEPTLKLVRFEPAVESPYVVQLFGAEPLHFATATRIVSEQVRPDGIDINFGCPVPKVKRQGAGAILMGNPSLARQVVESVLNNTNLPVSIKIRAHMEKGEGDARRRVDALEFLAALEGLPLAAVMIHGRSMAQGHSGAVDFELIKAARPLVPGVLLANGGVVDAATGLELLEKTAADGLGIARGAIGRPWIFTELKEGRQISKETQEIFALALRQAELAYKYLGAAGLIELRKHLSAYVRGLPNAAELRQRLVQVKALAEIEAILSQ